MKRNTETQTPPWPTGWGDDARRAYAVAIVESQRVYNLTMEKSRREHNAADLKAWLVHDARCLDAWRDCAAALQEALSAGIPAFIAGGKAKNKEKGRKKKP